MNLALDINAISTTICKVGLVHRLLDEFLGYVRRNIVSRVCYELNEFLVVIQAKHLGESISVQNINLLLLIGELG